MVEMASGSEKIMGAFKKWFGGNLFSKGKKIDHELYYIKVKSKGIKKQEYEKAIY